MADHEGTFVCCLALRTKLALYCTTLEHGKLKKYGPPQTKSITLEIPKDFGVDVNSSVKP